jgi:hypothetical protein
MYMLPTHLSPIEFGLAFIGFALLTYAVTITIMDYKSKAKHINKRGW